MNYKTMLKGTLAFSLSLMVGSAMASTTTTSDTQAYEETFEAASVDTPISDARFRGANQDSSVYGWLAPENDESKIIEGGPSPSTRALQLNTDAGTLTNLFSQSVAEALNDGIDGTAGAGAYFETEVKFVPSDTLDAGIAGGQDATKFAIYAYADENNNTTNLVVFHKCIVNGAPVYTNEQFGAVNCDVYTKLRVEMKQTENALGDPLNVFSVKVGNDSALTSATAFEDGIWFLTCEDATGNLNNMEVSSLNFKGTGEIDNIKAGVITETTTYAIDWTGSQNVVVSNNNAQLTVADTNFLAGAVLTFYPTEGSITNVNGVAQDPALESYDYTVGSADAIVTVLAGEEPAQQGYKDPQGNDISDAGMIAWITAKGFTQAEINALGNDAAATAKLTECYLLNCDITASGAGGTLSITAITVGNEVSVTVALDRTGELGQINGTLKLLGGSDLTGFGSTSVVDLSAVKFAEDGTSTASFSAGQNKFFKAVIE